MQGSTATAIVTGTALSPQYGHVAMLHFGRAGSTVLLDLLAQTPGLVNGREPFVGYFGPYLERMREQGRFVEFPWSRSLHHPHDPFAYLGERLPGDGRRLLASIKLYHVRGLGLGFDAFLRGLDALGFTHFVLLTRKSYLRKVVSCLVAEAKDARGDAEAYFNVSLQPAERVVVRLDPQRLELDSDERPLLDYFEEWDHDFAMIRRLLVGRQSVELSYEDHVQADPQAACRTLRSFLGAEQTPVRLRLGQTTPHALEDILENYDEVSAHLAPTRWGWMAPPRERARSRGEDGTIDTPPRRAGA